MNVFELMASIALDTSAYERGLETAALQTSAFADSLRADVSSAARAVLDSLAGLGSDAAALGRGVVAGLWDGISSQSGWLEGQLSSMLGSLVESVQPAGATGGNRAENGASAATIVVQVPLDGQVIYENAYQYMLERERAYGGSL